MGRHSTDPPPCADLLLEEESCADDLDGELDGLWTTISIFITLFLLSVCYSATVTLFKVGAHPAGSSGPLSVPRLPAVPQCPSLPTHSLLIPLGEAHVGSSPCSPCPPTGEMDLLLSSGAEEDDRPRLQEHDWAGRLELLWVEGMVAPDLAGPRPAPCAAPFQPGLLLCALTQPTSNLSPRLTHISTLTLRPWQLAPPP